MSLAISLVILAFSLTGVLLGIALSQIAPEEMHPGKKHLLLLRRILFVTALLTVSYGLFEVGKYIHLGIFAALGVTLIATDLNLKTEWHQIGIFLLFIIPYVLFLEQQLRLVTASLIFVYGFPLGTLLMEENDAEKNRK